MRSPRANLKIIVLAAAFAFALSAPSAFAATAPVAVSNIHLLAEDASLSIAAPGVLGNDSDADLEPLFATLSSSVSHGILALSANGSFTYVPEPNWYGTDRFSYRAFDGSLYSDSATVTLSVTPINDEPSFAEGPDVTVLEDSGSHQSSWATSISAGPLESQALSASVVCDNPALFASQPSMDASGVLRFTPALNASGSTLATVTLTDAGGALECASDLGDNRAGGQRPASCGDGRRSSGEAAGGGRRG